MSRLYINHVSDLTVNGHRACEKVAVMIYYGRTCNSKLAVTLEVEYPKGAEVPTIHLYRANQVIVKEETFIQA